METECSKRVYQGVRVKHTVKDLLAEKRSQQTSGPHYSGVSPPTSPFVQMSGSHMLPSYYGMRRPFISDTEFCSSTKPFSADVYPSSLTGKSLSCDTGCVSGYSSLMDSYYPDSFGDYRSTPFSSGGSTIFSPSALSSLLPSYSSDTSHYLLQRDSWEATGGDGVEGLCGDALAPMPLSTPSTLVNPDTVSPTQFRSSSRGSSLTSSQSYSLHSLDEVNYHSSFQTTSGSFASPSFMTEPATKLLPVLPSENAESAPSALSDSLVWGKEDTASTWSQYELFQSFPPFLANMSADNLKVYQGVRVKTTVKELLQKHRALQAEKTATKSQAVAARDVYSTTMNTHLDVFGMQVSEPYFQTRPFTDNVNIPMENAYDHQQMIHMMPPETFSGSNFVYPTSAQWSNGYLPSNTDLYGTSLVPRSPSDSFNFPSPVDHNSYSPPQSNSSSSSCYNSPTRMDLSSSFSPENYHYQHCNLQHCFCRSHCSNVQEGMATSEFAPYGSSDCLYSYGDDSYFRRDTSNSEMCYL